MYAEDQANNSVRIQDGTFVGRITGAQQFNLQKSIKIRRGEKSFKSIKFKKLNKSDQVDDPSIMRLTENEYKES